MEIKKLESALKYLGLRTINFDILISDGERLIDKYAALHQELLANKCWVYQKILYVHKIYNQAFFLLKSKKYNAGWNLLGRVEIEIGFLKKHIHLVDKNYRINFIEANIIKLQALFPYHIFASSEFISKEEVCGICRMNVSVRNPCGHLPGELYMGIMCNREVTISEMLGLALVENPVNKYSVMFNESKDPIIRDNEQFGNLNYILNFLKGPYEPWDMEVTARLFPHTDYPGLQPEDSCPCHEGKLYKDCCFLKEGIQGFHYQFGLSRKASSRLNKTKSKNRHHN